MIQPGRSYDPDPRQGERYAENYAKFKQLWPLLRDYLTG